jgi:hypothetical protein
MRHDHGGAAGAATKEKKNGVHVYDILSLDFLTIAY